MKSSYSEKDVIVLLKDVTGMMKPLDTLEREKMIQSGKHYSEMLPLEYKPTEKYIKIYNEALEKHKKITADAVAVVSEKILREKGREVVLVSLARAGTPIGILIKRYLDKKYNLEVKHYTISIIRDRGIDHEAMKYILSHHKGEDIQFVDGWIGKGAIIGELRKVIKDYKGVSSELAVLADPARLTRLYGTYEDFLIPSSCLNATVSGLFSRTILNDQVISRGDFHGAVYYSELETVDRSMSFINEIEECFDYSISLNNEENVEKECNGLTEAQQIAKDFNIDNINFVKPGIGETTRVLLRRVPWKILVRDLNDKEHIAHILELCNEKNIEVIEYPLREYRACGIIKNLSDI